MIICSIATAARHRLRRLLNPENPPTLVPSSILISPTSFNVAEGGTAQLTATVYDQLGQVMSGESVTWASTATGVATVNSSGLVTGVAAGTATISATSVTDASVTATNPADCTVSAPAVASVDVSPSSLSLIAGQTGTVTFQPKDSNGNALVGRTVTGSTAAAGTATIGVTGYSGTVTAVAAGSTTVKGTSETVDSPTVAVAVSASGSGSLPNKPSWLGTIVAERPWAAAVENGWANGTGGQGSLRTDFTDAPYSPNLGSRYSIALGSTGKSMGTTSKAITGVTELYASIWCRLSSTFDGHSTNTNKLGLWFQIDGGSQIFTNLNGNGANPLRAEVYLQGVVPSLGGNDASGGQRIRSTTGLQQITITRGVWFQWELYVKLNTFNVADGIIRSYIDGVQHVEKLDACLIGSGTQVPGSASSKIDGVKWNPIWGGGGADTVSTQTYIDVDHLIAYAA